MEEKQITMLEAITDICDRYSVDEETIAVYIRQSHKLKEQLKQEALQLKMLKE